MKQKFQSCQARLLVFAREEDGPTATEYAIMLAMIVLGSMAVIRSIGVKFQAIYLAIANQIPNA